MSDKNFEVCPTCESVQTQANMVEQVRMFNDAAGNSTSRTLNPRQAALYFGLQCEEFAEKLRHLGFGTSSNQITMIGNQFKSGAFDYLFADMNREGRVAMLDDDVDVLVVTLGSMFSMGVDVHGAINEVHRSNMSKVWPDGKMHKDENGKVIKPETYSRPNLLPFIGG